MSVLGDFISPRIDYAKSVQIERDLDDVRTLEGYLPTQRALDLSRGILQGLSGETNERAWSVTGPYGSGKSSFVQFLTALLAAPSSSAYASARDLFEKAGLEVEKATGMAKRREAEQRVIRCLATAQREPIARTIKRALLNGVDDRWGSRKSSAAASVLSLLEKPDPSSTSLLRSLSLLRQAGPVVLIVDELGKNLEAAAEDPSSGDLFILQQIAESFRGPAAHPAVIVTLQHLSFEDYAGALPDAYRREWRKVQGRFQDVPFEVSPAEFRGLIARGLVQKELPGGIQKSLERSAAAAVKWIAKHNYETEFPGGAELLLGTYPLHPAVLLVLPDLCFRLGQHDRTLFAFLSGASPHAVPAFLSDRPISGELDWVTLEHVYLFFLDGLGSGSTAGVELSRLLEVQSRIREAEGLTNVELACLRTLGVLNLVADRGSLRASRELLRFALGTPGRDSEHVSSALESLEQKGLLTYVEFADELRIWRGTDFDLKGAVANQRERLSHLSLATHLQSTLPLPASVAHRHSYRTGTLRYFESVYVDGATTLQQLTSTNASSDGVTAYVLSSPNKRPEVPPRTADGKPLIAVFGEEPRLLRELALDAAALEAVLNEAPDDPVARQEIRRRASLAQSLLRERVNASFDPKNKQTRWFANGGPVRLRGEADVSRLLSELCDEAYAKSPVLQNEMLNRRDLTSQGAKTRRELLEAMLAKEPVLGLGIGGNGPDWAMYESVLRLTGIHRDRDGEGPRMGPPKQRSGLASVWKAVMAFFDESADRPRTLDELYAVLMSEPYGMKAGPIPVVLLAALQYRSEDVAIYQDGSYQPLLTPDLFERLVVTPNRFAVKHLKVGGVRNAVFSALEQMLVAGEGSPALRNRTTLSLVRPLVAFIRGLPPYSIKTKHLSPRSDAVRRALTTTKQPDELLFESLPVACGMSPFSAWEKDDVARAQEFAKALSAAVEEIRDAYPSLLRRISASLLEGFGTRGGDLAIREDLRARSRQLMEQVIEPRLRSFLFSASNHDFDEEDWLESIGMNLSGKPPRSWIDEDEARFEVQLGDVARTFRRVERLHYDLRDQAVGTDEGFHVRRITITKPDGYESHGIAWVEEGRLGSIQRIADDLVEQAVARLDGVDPKALLAAMSEKLLAEPTSSDAKSASVRGAESA